MKKLLDLYEGISLYEVSIHETREQEVNARVMEQRKFERLKANISKDSRLETLPLGYIKERKGKPQMMIISGHHRTRAARMAGIQKLYFLAIDEELTEDEIKAKQLAHNSLSGEDDIQILDEIYQSIQDIDAKIESGVFEDEIQKSFANVNFEETEVEWDYETVKIMFLPYQKEKFDSVLDLIEIEIEKDDHIYTANKQKFEQYATAIEKVSTNDNIRNVASIMDRMCEIVKEHYAKQEKNEEKE